MVQYLSGQKSGHAYCYNKVMNLSNLDIMYVMYYLVNMEGERECCDR